MSSEASAVRGEVKWTISWHWTLGMAAMRRAEGLTFLGGIGRLAVREVKLLVPVMMVVVDGP